MSDQLDAFGLQIEENSYSIKILDSSLDDAVENLDEIEHRIDRNEIEIESLQSNMTDTNRKIDEVGEHQRELRNDFEYLKYDFRSFTNEISKWQIDVDERLSATEDQIQGIL